MVFFTKFEGWPNKEVSHLKYDCQGKFFFGGLFCRSNKCY